MEVEPSISWKPLQQAGNKTWGNWPGTSHRRSGDASLRSLFSYPWLLSDSEWLESCPNERTYIQRHVFRVHNEKKVISLFNKLLALELAQGSSSLKTHDGLWIYTVVNLTKVEPARQCMHSRCFSWKSIEFRPSIYGIQMNAILTYPWPSIVGLRHLWFLKLGKEKAMINFFTVYPYHPCIAYLTTFGCFVW